MKLARQAGFTAISLGGTYGNAKPDSFKVAPRDAHPDALGHNSIADGLFAALIAETGGLFSLSGAASRMAEETRRKKGN